jgi:RNA polymerase sigma-70 factor (ECF subfamily)
MTARAAPDLPQEPEPGIAPPQHKAVKGDRFEELFMTEYGRVVAVANRVLADRGEAEDVAQEVFLDFHRRHRPDAPFAGAWLHRAAVHTSLNRLRSQRRREKRELGQALAERPAPPDDPARLAEIAEERRTVRTALLRLRPKAAAVLVLRYSGLSYAEVGAALKVGTGQVGTLLRRAEQALKKELEVGTPV